MRGSSTRTANSSSRIGKARTAATSTSSASTVTRSKTSTWSSSASTSWCTTRPAVKAWPRRPKRRPKTNPHPSSKAARCSSIPSSSARCPPRWASTSGRSRRGPTRFRRTDRRRRVLRRTRRRRSVRLNRVGPLRDRPDVDAHLGGQRALLLGIEQHRAAFELGCGFVFGRRFGRLGHAFTAGRVVHQLVLADEDHVAVFERVTVDALLVDVAAVRAFQILEDEFAVLVDDPRMVAGDRGVIDHYGVVGQTSDLQGVGPQLVLFEYLVAKPQHYLRHRGLLRLLCTRLTSSRHQPPITSTTTTVTLSMPPLRFAASMSASQIQCGSRTSATISATMSSVTMRVRPSLHSST